MNCVHSIEVQSAVTLVSDLAAPKYYFSTNDLVAIATLTAVQSVISISVVSVVRGFIHGVLHLPGPGAGIAIFGGFMFTTWILLAYGLTLKRGAATITSLLMGVVHLFYGGIGPLGGPPVFVVYLVTGLFAELGLLLPSSIIKYPAAGALGTTSFLFTFVGMMGYYQGTWGVWLLAKGWTWAAVFTVVGVISGVFLGGAIAIGVLKSLQRAGLAPLEQSKG